MEAPSLMNKGYSTMHQQKQLQSPATMQSNNKQFGVGNHGHMMPRPLYSSPPIVGQKRDSSAFDLGQGVSQDGGNFVKLFVGHLPRNVTEDDIRSLFAEHGNVLEVSLVRDNKRIGQQHGCCFIKYATVEEAERAIKALHNQHTLQGGVGPLQVRYADGEREQLVEHKLFVGSLNKQATEKEIEEIFTPYGTVDDVYIMRDEQKQSRGCAFVKFPSREMAAAAISGLNGAYVMRGCNQPLAVRFAEPKRPKPGDTRGSPAYGGPGFGTELQRSFGSRPSLGVGSHMGGRGTPTNWRPMGAANMRTPSPQVGPNPYVSPSNPSVRGGSAGGPPPMGGPVSGSGSSANGPPIRAHISSPMGGPGRMPAPSQQLSFNSSPAQRQTQAHGWSASVLQPRQMQQQLQPPMQQQQQQHPQSQPSFSQLQPQQSLQQYGQQFQTSQPVGQQQQHPFAQASASQQPLSLYAQFAVSQPPVQQPVAPLPHQTAPSLPLPTMQLQHQQQSQPQSQQQPALQPVHQHSHALQPNFQSQQHPSLQQQQQHAPLMQTATQSQQQPMTVQPQQQQAYYQMASTQQPAQQQPWTFSVQTQAVASTVSVGPASVVPATITVAAATAAATAPVTAPIAAAVTCVWSEHTSPEGHKYYYNSVTGESKWEKPEELTVFEQQQQAKHLQQPRLQPQSQPQLQSQQQPQPQLQAQPQLQPQPQLQSQQQQQQQAQLMSSNLSYGQLQAPNTTVNPVHHYAQQQSLPATQDWMWKARPAGT